MREKNVREKVDKTKETNFLFRLKLNYNVYFFVGFKKENWLHLQIV